MNTKQNLLRAYIGECQARARYEMAANVAKKEKLQVLEKVLNFTASQEEQHAIVFYDHLKTIFKEENINVEYANFPIDIQNDLGYLLKRATHNEQQEADDVYKEFSHEAKKEGYLEVATSFMMVSEIEKFHQQRFQKYLDLYTTGNLFTSTSTQKWMCLNCGFIYEGSTAPGKCPVCHHDQGYYIRLEDAPYFCC